MNLLEQQLCELGFVKPNKNKLETSYKYYLGRRRFISAMCLGTGNESMWLCYKEDMDSEIINDLICLHNVDYDGKLTISKVKHLLEFFTTTESAWAVKDFSSLLQEVINDKTN